MDDELLELLWTNHGHIFSYWFTDHRENEKYTDATIGCEGKLYAVHKLVLATCSQYFEDVFEHTSGKHPVLLLHDVKQQELEAILCYMYTGKASVSHLNFSRFMTVAKALQIKGLAVSDGETNQPMPPSKTPQTCNERTSISGSSSWQENEGDFISMSDDYESQEGSKGEQGDNHCEGDDMKQQTIYLTRNEKQEVPNQYSFRGFASEDAEDTGDADLIKKREVLEKIISQTEKQIKKEAEVPEEHKPSVPQADAVCLKRRGDGRFLVQKKSLKMVTKASASQPGSSRVNNKEGIKKRNPIVPKGSSMSKISKLKITTMKGQNLYECKKCHFNGNYLRMKKHLKSHFPTKSFKCPLCSLSFSRKYALLRHQERHEKDEQEMPDKLGQFACTYCHARFSNQEFLTSHLETHDKSKPYMCTICQTSFSRKDKLTVHMKNHESEGKNKVTGNVKNSHVKVFECQECQAEFESHSELLDHSEMHANEKQFPCTVCPAAFAKKVQLSRHVMTHKGFGSRDKFQDYN